MLAAQDWRREAQQDGQQGRREDMLGLGTWLGRDGSYDGGFARDTISNT